ncbi:MAG: hypothetical protein HQ592_03035, partial [Planctomycetes bacterium]|nr:hypothetical protein [Planctomycetota bacterium]
MRLRIVCALFCTGVCLAASVVFGETERPAAPSVTLAADGVARLPVVVASNATERVRAAAADLAEMLGRITGAEFTLTNGPASAGIVVGTVDDWPALEWKKLLLVDDLSDREAYI